MAQKRFSRGPDRGGCWAGKRVLPRSGERFITWAVQGHMSSTAPETLVPVLAPAELAPTVISALADGAAACLVISVRGVCYRLRCALRNPRLSWGVRV